MNHKRQLQSEYLIGAFRRLADSANRPASTGSPYFREMERAIVDIQLFGDRRDVESVYTFLDEFSERGQASLDPLLSRLRNKLRRELKYGEVKENVRWFRPEGSPDLTSQSMLIERIFPAVVAKKSTLRDCLSVEAKARGLSIQESDHIVSIVPGILVQAGAFLDKMTNLWRYEFGIPYEINSSLLWGTHMWVPVQCLFNALHCAHSRLPVATSAAYLERLAQSDKHQEALVEMIPDYKVDSSVKVQFEVVGKGVGNRTIDWLIEPHDDRAVLLDVKRRSVDLIEQAERTGNETSVPTPEHDPALLFRSVEDKFKSSDPNLCLQGVWIVTYIQQNEEKLAAAFDALDANKVHFAILGDWELDAFILVKRAEDEQYLRDLFHLHESARFTFASLPDG